MRIIVNFLGGALDGHVEFDTRPRGDIKRARRKIESAAWVAIMAADSDGVGARFWSVSPEFVDAVKRFGPTDPRTKALAGRHLYEITQFERGPEQAGAVCLWRLCRIDISPASDFVFVAELARVPRSANRGRNSGEFRHG